MTDDEQRLLGTVDAARALGVDRTTLSRWASRGLVRPSLTTAGGHHRWRLTELREQLAALRAERPDELDQ